MVVNKYVSLLPDKVSTWMIINHPTMINRRAVKALFVIVTVFAVVMYLTFPSMQNGGIAPQIFGPAAQASSTINPSTLSPKEVENQNMMSYLAIPDILNEPLVDEKRLIQVTEDDPAFNFTSSNCPVESWNTINSDTIPNLDMLNQWKARNMSFRNTYLYHKSPSVLAAYVYNDHIAVTTTSGNYFGKAVYCRYYDCNRKEIPKQFVSQVFPESTVYCARRAGAKYMSITETLEEKPEAAVPIQKRLKPKHFFTVCMSTIYGEEPKFLQIVEFVEYYKLQGASFFHIYIRNISSYDRILLDDYIRTNDVEVIKMHDHYWREDFMWHHVQVNDCHHRNKYFSKWTAVVDIDERIEMKSKETDTIGKYLDTVVDPNINTLQFAVQWVVKNETSPARFLNENQIVDGMIFRKYHNTSQVGPMTDQPKCIIRPERVAIMDIHWPFSVYKGELITQIDKNTGVVRHYRSTSRGPLLQDNLEVMYRNGPFEETNIDPWVALKLTGAITERVKWVYNTQEVTCPQKQRTYANHGMNATCWLEMIKNDPSLETVTFRPAKFTH